MKIQIDRSRWRRGEPGQGFFYDKSSGCYCAMGFLLKSLGVKSEDMDQIAGLADLYLDKKYQDLLDEKLPEGLRPSNDSGVFECTDMEDRIEGTNDTTLAGDREATLKRLFGYVGVEVEFVDET